VFPLKAIQAGNPRCGPLPAAPLLHATEAFEAVLRLKR